jgi:hypothetical protein
MPLLVIHTMCQSHLLYSALIYSAIFDFSYPASGASAGSLMAAMIGTRDDEDLKKMLDARSVYGLSLRRDYFRPKSEIDSPTGNIFSLLPSVLLFLSIFSLSNIHRVNSSALFVVYHLFFSPHYYPSFTLPNFICCIDLCLCVRSTNAALGADITALDIRSFPWILLRLEGRTFSLFLYCTVLCCAVLCCAVLCCAVLCCAVLCCAVLCCAVLCCAVLCCAIQLLTAF